MVNSLQEKMDQLYKQVYRKKKKRPPITITNVALTTEEMRRMSKGNYIVL